MICTEFYKGQGLGNQLWCYVVTRALALDLGYDFGFEQDNKMLGCNFLNLDFGKTVTGIKYHYQEKEMRHPENNADIRIYDKDLFSIKDGTKIDGVLQDEQYIIKHKEEIRQWLRVKDEYDCHDFAKENICIINFRGGEYSRHEDLFLRQKYWDDAILNMKKINPDFQFIVITDDTKTAKEFFLKYDVFHFDIGKDYSIIKNAHYLILSNSSFAFFPAWLSTNLKYCIAPKYWARHNVSDGYWSCGYNITRGWMYQDRDGILFEYQACIDEFNAYKKQHIDYFIPVKTQNGGILSLIKKIIIKLK